MKTSNSGHKYIYWVKSNKHYVVSKLFNGKSVYYGSFKTLGEAVRCKQYYQQRNWVKDDKFRKRKDIEHPKHILPVRDKFVISKRYKGKARYYGTYDTMEEAIKVRDELIKKGWGMPKRKRRYRKSDTEAMRKLEKMREEIMKGGDLYIK